METNRFLGEANGNVLAVVTLVIASLLGTVGLTMNDEVLDGVQWSAVSSANARDDATRIKTSELRANDTWAADDSAQGTRPDASH